MSAHNAIRNPWIVRAMSLLVFLGGWQLLADYVSPLTFASPGLTATRFYQLWMNGEMQTATTNTLESILVGFMLAIVVALPLGLLMGTNRTTEYSLDPYINLIYATPLIVIIPIIGVTLGSNMTSTYLIVFIAAVLPLLINVMAGVKSVNRDMLETADSFGMRGFALWRNVIFPSAMPYTMAGLRIGVGHAVIGAILAEMFLYGNGLGGMIYDYTGIFDTGAIIGAVVVIMIIGIALSEGVGFFEKRVSGWSQTATGTG